MQKRKNDFDLIIIGSGIGGLTCAAIMAKMYNKKVLVLERHSVIGGLTHEFRRNNYQWDVGLHYVGGMGEGEFGRRIMDYLTDGHLKWLKMPEFFEAFNYPDFTFRQSSDPHQYQNDLLELFPAERKAIKRYFRDLNKVSKELGIHLMKSNMPKFIAALFGFIEHFTKHGIQQSTKAYLDENFEDPKLKALLASQWGDYGLPPDQSSFAMHALIVKHYINGAYFPVGGSAQIAKGIIPVIEQAGGVLLPRHEVIEILIKNNTAIGVKVDDPHSSEPKTFKAPIIVSDAGAKTTYLKLIKDPSTVPFINEVKSFDQGHSAVTLYIGLKRSPKDLGLMGENHWIFEDYNHDDFEQHQLAMLAGKPKYCFLSFPSLKNPESKAHTAELIHFCDYSLFEQWQDQHWLRRGEAYTDLKEKIAIGLLDLVEKHIPGFKDLVDYQELSTPLSMEHFTNRSQGTMYGIPATPDRYKLKWLKAKTPIQNLYLTGSDVGSLGIMGAVLGGIITTGVLNGGLSIIGTMSKIQKESRQ